MFLPILILSFLSVNSSSLDDAKAKCNMIDNPKGRATPSDDPTGNYCEQADDSTQTGYSCCFESYRMLSSMTYTCKFIDISSEDKFNEEKDFLKDYNAKNITIKCKGTFNQISISAILIISIFIL